MSLIQDAKKKLGELFITGFSGMELSDDTTAFLSQAQIGGVIIFAHNYENPAQIAELSNQIQECRTDLPLWISVDHEGGKVQRFKRTPFTRIPDAHAIGLMDSPKLTFDVADIMAKELKAVGMNVNFCPVADIHTNPKNPVIGVRAFGTDEETVSKHVTAMVRGHMVNNVVPCVKHFPGHGDTNSDSHFALPKVDTPIEILREREFKPFLKSFKSRCPMVMTAHVLLPKIDPDFPATLSKKILQDFLRNELRYNRLIISDDLEMKAITDHYGVEEAPRMALIAGCDLLIYRSEGPARQAYESLTRDLDSGKLPAEVVLEAAERSQTLKKEILLPYTPIQVADVGKLLGLPESLALMQKIEENAKKHQ